MSTTPTAAEQALYAAARADSVEEWVRKLREYKFPREIDQGPYASLLLCMHNDLTNVFHNGLPIGVCRAGGFKIHEHTMPNGDNVAVKLDASFIRKALHTLAVIEASRYI